MARVRSPNYPAFSLPEAIARVKLIHAQEQHLAAPKEVIAKHLGYGGMNGASIKTLSAIMKYGLLEEIGSDKIRVSPLAISILYPAKPEERQVRSARRLSSHLYLQRYSQSGTGRSQAIKT
jgi:hypothetical protein